MAAEPITDIDTTAAEMLGQLLDELEVEATHLVFAELKGPVKDRLRSYGLYHRLGDDRFYATLGTAINGYLDALRRRLGGLGPTKSHLTQEAISYVTFAHFGPERRYVIPRYTIRRGWSQSLGEDCPGLGGLAGGFVGEDVLDEKRVGGELPVGARPLM